MKPTRTKNPTIDIKPKLWPWSWRLALDWLIIAAFFWLSWRWHHPAIWIISAIVIGSRQHAIGILGHDGAHRLVCRNRFWNDFLTSIFCLWPLQIPLAGYRRFHFNHHRNVGTDQDPERLHKKLFPQWGLPLKPWRLIGWILADLLGGGVPHIGMAVYLTRPVSWKDALGPILFWTLILTICFFLKVIWIPILWFACLLTTFWISFRLRIWTEHVGTSETHRLSAALWQRFLFLPHGTWHHYEHHLYPKVPFWSLAKIRAQDIGCRKPKLQTVGQLFWRFLKNRAGDH